MSKADSDQLVFTKEGLALHSTEKDSIQKMQKPQMATELVPVFLKQMLPGRRHSELLETITNK